MGTAVSEVIAEPMRKLLVVQLPSQPVDHFRVLAYEITQLRFRVIDRVVYRFSDYLCIASFASYASRRQLRQRLCEALVKLRIRRAFVIATRNAPSVPNIRLETTWFDEQYANAERVNLIRECFTCGFESELARRVNPVERRPYSAR